MTVLTPQPQALMRKALTCHVPPTPPPYMPFAPLPLEKSMPSRVEMPLSFSAPAPLSIQPPPSLPLWSAWEISHDTGLVHSDFLVI